MDNSRSFSSNDAQPVGPPDFDQLNRSFYAAEPAAYFRTKVLVLGLLIARSDELNSMLDGLTIEDLVLSAPSGPATAEDERNHLAYLVTESESLVHHLAETLVRLFLAHREVSACPWFAVAELKQFQEFKAQASALVASRSSDELLDQVLDVFIGGDDDARAREAGITVRRLLVQAAERITKDANAYNSVKHGLAVQAGEAGLTLSSDQGSILGVQGPAITFLEMENSDEGTDYYVTTTWTDLRSNLLLAQLLVVAIDALWTVARARYTGAPITGVELPSAEALQSLIDSPTRPNVRNFRHKVATRPRGRGRGLGRDRGQSPRK